MRTFRLLAAAAVGAWAGWRVGRAGPVGTPSLRRSAPEGADRAAGGSRGASILQEAGDLLGAVRAKELPVVVEKLVALVELGGERGIELVQNVVGRRTGDAA